jgi:hypothetical protein
MLSSQEEQAERRRVMAQDASLRQQQEEQRRVFADQSLPNQASTYNQHALADAQTPRGRFSAVENATVVGSKPNAASAYPPAAPHQHDPCGQEPALGYRIDAMEPSTVFSSVSPVEQTDGPTDPATPLAGGSSFSQSDDPATEGTAPPSASSRGARGLAGSSPPFRRIK